MFSTVIYDSEFGTTRALAEAIAEEARRSGAVQLINVRVEPRDVPAHVDLVFVGGPTQVHGVSPALRTYLDRLPSHALDRVPVATFDTRVHGPRLLTGAASSGIARRLTRRGGHLVQRPESFVVDGREGPLAVGELERARSWAQSIVARLAKQKAPANVSV
jgi:flavodoxin